MTHPVGNKMPLVSIMIPTFNQKEFIINAIRSAQRQTYPNMEIIVSDDCSTDGTEEAVEQYLLQEKDSRLKFVRNPVNLGILRHYRNALYEHASGEWVVNLDGDDFFLDNTFINECVRMSAVDDDIVLVFGDYSEYHGGRNRAIAIKSSCPVGVMDDKTFLLAYAEDNIRWNHSTIMYRRFDAIRLGFYWHHTKPRNDWESFLRLVVGRKVAYLGLNAAAWVHHGANETRRLDRKKYINNFKLIDNVYFFACERGIDNRFLMVWKKKMYIKSARSSYISYIINRDIVGAIGFLRVIGRINLNLAVRLVLDPTLTARWVLSLNRRSYLAIKDFFWSMRGKARRNM